MLNVGDQTMKKVIITIITIITAFCLTGCGGPKTYDEITYNELETMIKNKEDFILMIGAESCSACKSYKIALDKVIEKYKVDIKYIDNDKLSSDEYADLESNFYFTATPTIVFVENGKEADRMVGNKKYSETVEILKEKKYIKE